MNSLKVLLVTLALAVSMVIAAGCGGEKSGDGSAERAQNETRAPAPVAEGGEAHEEHDRADRADVVAATCNHGADASLCYFCDASLRDPARLWCKEHNRYEDRCFICHPELRDDSRLYCNEHGTYEDECFICHPELFESKDDARADAPAGDAVAAAAPETGAEGGLYCKEHDLHETECGICHPELADKLEPGAALKIRFPSVASAQKAGVTTSYPVRESGGHAVNAVGEVGYNLNRLARVTPLADGVVRAVHADLSLIHISEPTRPY